MDEKTWYWTDDIKGMIEHLLNAGGLAGCREFGFGLRKRRLLCLSQIYTGGCATASETLGRSPPWWEDMKKLLLEAADSPTDSEEEFRSRCRSFQRSKPLSFAPVAEGFILPGRLASGNVLQPSGWLFHDPSTSAVSASNLRDLLPNFYRPGDWWIIPGSNFSLNGLTDREVYGDIDAYNKWTKFCSNPLLQDLAQIAYDSGDTKGQLDPAALSVLADALEDFNCNNQEVVRHLRGRRKVKTAATVILSNKSRSSHILERSPDFGWNLHVTRAGSMVPSQAGIGFSFDDAVRVAEKILDVPANSWVEKHVAASDITGRAYEAQGAVLVEFAVSHHVRGCWALDSVLGKC
jgi:hypothetical protein